MIRVARIDGDEYVCYCPFHEDLNASLYINPRKNAAICFAGCYKGSAVGLVSKIENINKVKAWDLLKSEDIFSFDLYEKPKNISNGVSDQSKDIKWVSGDSISYLIDRGFTRSTIRFWNIEYSPMIRHIRIPVYQRDGSFHCYSYRTIEDLDPKYLHPGLNKKSGILFGESFYSEHKNVVNLVEGALDCIWLWQNRFRNTLAFLGNPSREQVENILNFGNKIRFCLDNDQGGDTIRTDVLKKIGDKLKSYWIISIPEGKKDVQELSRDELYDIMLK